MRFQHYDNLRVFNVVAYAGSFSAAADELHLTKGAVSYRIKQLEVELGFAVFTRGARGVQLTSRGQELLGSTLAAFESVEQKISELQDAEPRGLTIGVSTYFASRWLSPRLMDFMRHHQDIRLRIQPMINLENFQREGIDIAIRWGKGDWTDIAVDPLLSCPSWPVGNKQVLQLVEQEGLAAALGNVTLLRDRDGSNAWTDWHEIAGIPFKKSVDTLVIPDPNVRVQAVIDGQGIALNDELVTQELANKTLFRLSDHELSNYGYYLAYQAGALANREIAAFADWLRQTAQHQSL